MAKASKKSAKKLQDESGIYSLSELLVKRKNSDSISKEAALEHLYKLSKQLPKDPA